MEKTEVVNKVTGPICTKPNMTDRVLKKKGTIKYHYG